MERAIGEVASSNHVVYVNLLQSDDNWVEIVIEVVDGKSHDVLRHDCKVDIIDAHNGIVSAHEGGYGNRTIVL